MVPPADALLLLFRDSQASEIHQILTQLAGLGEQTFKDAVTELENAQFLLPSPHFSAWVSRTGFQSASELQAFLLETGAIVAKLAQLYHPAPR